MDRITIIGIDISKRSFQLHGATADGKPVFGKKLSREKFLVFLSEAPPCLVVMEACGGAHYWGRQIIALGHRCMLIPPIYVKPFLKRQKNDSNDAAAIVEAAQRPTMRFVAVKSEEAQADAMLFRTRALLVRQRTQTINSLRGQLAEFGVIAAQGVAGLAVMRLELAEVEGSLPEQVVSMAKLLFKQIAALSQKIAGLEKGIRSRTRARADMKRLMTIAGYIDGVYNPVRRHSTLDFHKPRQIRGRSNANGVGRLHFSWMGPELSVRLQSAEQTDEQPRLDIAALRDRDHPPEEMRRHPTHGDLSWLAVQEKCFGSPSVCTSGRPSSAISLRIRTLPRPGT